TSWRTAAPPPPMLPHSRRGFPCLFFDFFPRWRGRSSKSSSSSSAARRAAFFGRGASSSSSRSSASSSGSSSGFGFRTACGGGAGREAATGPPDLPVAAGARTAAPHLGHLIALPGARGADSFSSPSQDGHFNTEKGAPGSEHFSRKNIFLR